MTSSAVRPNSFLQRLASKRFVFLWRTTIVSILLIYLGLLAWQTSQRAIFPWDIHIWSESPFMTDLLKLEHGSPVYTTPADVNSFVYSPSLEYLTFAALKPFGVELDIRYCRLVIILIGLVAAGCGALALRRLARSSPELAMGRGAWLAGLAALVLVLFKNFTSDIPHPDSLHILHALLVFYLCYTAIETTHFGLALVAMIVSGLGVLAKQTDALCFVGPAAVFAIMNAWGWRRWLLLAGVGALITGLSLWCLWLPPYARFYTFELLSHQNISFAKLFLALRDLLARERGVLVLLSVLTVPRLWNLRGSARNYLICAVAVGAAAGLPNTMAYIKEFGLWNNLGVLEIFLAVIVWPFVWSFPEFCQARAKIVTPANPSTHLTLFASGGLATALVLIMIPIKATPQPGYYRYCEAINASARDDVKAGRKVMVSHGAEFLIRAGDLQVPKDRANSFMELHAGHASHLAGTESRIRSHYYDRVYLFLGFGFSPQMIDTFHQNYQVIGKVPAYKMTPQRGYACGFQNNLWQDCEILAPRP